MAAALAAGSAVGWAVATVAGVVEDLAVPRVVVVVREENIDQAMQMQTCMKQGIEPSSRCYSCRIRSTQPTSMSKSYQHLGTSQVVDSVAGLEVALADNLA